MSERIKAKRPYESPRIKSVEAAGGDFVLRIGWANGQTSRVDLTETVFRLKSFRPLRDKKLFRQVKVGEWGWTVTWPDELDVSAEQLWQLAHEQKDAEITPSEFRDWLRKRKLTQEKAAALLGVSKRTVAYYATGAQPVTRLVRLAMKGLESERRQASTP